MARVRKSAPSAFQPYSDLKNGTLLSPFCHPFVTIQPELVRYALLSSHLIALPAIHPRLWCRQSIIITASSVKTLWDGR